MGFDVKKSQVKLKDTIKSLGEFNININLDHNLEAEIKLVVTEIFTENQKNAEE